MLFLANSYFILQIHHAKTFKMRYSRCLYNKYFFKDICDNDGRYFFVNSQVLLKNKENQNLTKITNMVKSLRANMLRPNEF